jgi:hypothetical protein
MSGSRLGFGLYGAGPYGWGPYGGSSLVVQPMVAPTQFAAHGNRNAAGYVNIRQPTWVSAVGGPLWPPIFVPPCVPWPVISIDAGVWQAKPNQAGAMFAMGGS